MNILLGVGVLAATALLFAFAYGAHLRPVPARWTRWPGTSMLVCVVLTTAGPTGLGLLIKGLINPIADLAQMALIEIVVVATISALAVMMVPVLMLPARGHSARRVVGGNAPANLQTPPEGHEPKLAA